MKNSLIALLWAILLVPASAQKNLPKSLLPYFENLNPKVISALSKAGFDPKTSNSRKTHSSVQLRSGALQLDSTKSFFGYDFIGANDTTPLLRTIYEYPLPSLEVQTYAQFDQDAWQNLSRSNLSKDNLNRIVEVYAEAFDTLKYDFVPDSRAVAFPHEDSQVLIDSIQVYSWDTLAMDWLLIFYVTNKFDAQDRLVESISSFDYFGQPLLLKDVHTYDANGDNTLIESFTLFNGLEIPSGRRELSYQNHLLTQVVNYMDDGAGGLFAQGKIQYSYTTFEQQEQVDTYQWSFDLNDWAQTQGDAYGYDNAQRVISKESVVYNQDGSEERNLSKYDYVEGDKLQSEANYYWSQSAFFLSDRNFYYYSDETLANQNPGSALPLLLSPNPSTGFARLNLTESATFQIYDAQGILVKSGAYTPNNVLNISDLPSGLYFVTASAENEQYVGRLVKE